MTLEVSPLPLSDSQITDITVGREDLTVGLRLWNDERLTLTFRNVSGIEAFAPIGQDISDCCEDANAPFLLRSREMEGDPAEAEAMKCYIFRSSVSDAPVLSIVAEWAEKASSRP